MHGFIVHCYLFSLLSIFVCYCFHLLPLLLKVILLEDTGLHIIPSNHVVGYSTSCFSSNYIVFVCDIATRLKKNKVINLLTLVDSQESLSSVSLQENVLWVLHLRNFLLSFAHFMYFLKVNLSALVDGCIL